MVVSLVVPSCLCKAARPRVSVDSFEHPSLGFPSPSPTTIASSFDSSVFRWTWTRRSSLSSEGDVFEVDAAVAMASQTIKFMIEGNCGYGGIPITNVSSMILAKVIQYCEKNVNVHAMSSDDVTKPAIEELIRWDEEFVKVEESTLLHLVLVADCLFETCIAPTQSTSNALKTPLSKFIFFTALRCWLR
ncbi:hypothetical protein ZIOFF_031481 [Zingiber officinale]|uniref:SKP1 component POZ domain-containing protein n=1 Tax=Zingiber officinale TaxID=94328 RepID=A0A8J5GM12_ZINOF|nr:hypothetical protein ZIOFF_031481 [Zingiber officinale]